MWQLAITPFILQAIAIFFDEFFFHVRRGLPKWERVGHPLDTLTVLFCIAFVLWVPFSKGALILYILLATFSTIFVTKDEFVHKEHCPASEQWLHALLFTLHPVTLALAGLIWPVIQGVPLIAWLDHPNELRLFLYGQFGTMSCFLLYQIVYWNILYDQQ